MSSNEILDRDQQPCSNGVLLSLIISMSDGQLLNQIYETHLPPIQDFDPTSLFTHIKEVLYLATHTVNNALLGTQDLDLENLGGQEFWDMEEYIYNHLSCTLEQISSELAAKSPDGASELRKTSMSILKKVSSYYSWAAKAVLTLAAFALDYGDFWTLSQLDSLDQLEKAVGIEKVLVLDLPLKRPDLQKWEKEIGEVSNLIKDTLEVIEFVVELERLSKLADTHGNILALTTAKDCIPLHAYCAIITVVACTTQMFYLSSDNNDKELELSPLTQKMDLNLNLLKKNIKDCHQQIEEVKKYQQKERVPEIPKKILEGFKAMIFAEENL
ncbi:protein SIEVE ELEMENT OCCLUSION B-like [Juglans microcarpa x Juglans regia]|uniref:protein SIEVE ELEMENT OCCLUSION B-like n=1 Tax=Juglans microcarpa x Juglans regia TaxID=2249226 RepID=UPI001B7E53B5|nr:protein SIEVE ELEMENT OCCLUSION B-like [Juglans microcarpa x Juglans regia]